MDVRMAGEEEDAARLERLFERQLHSAVQRSSSLYESLLRHCARDLIERGPTWQLLQDRAQESAGDALPLRLLAAAHRLVLGGEAPDLARFYPSAGGQRTPAEAWPAFRSLLLDRAEDLRTLLDRPLQTNEVRRCSALLVGLGWIAATSNLSPAVLEIGASAGLNLNWHRYRYQGEKVGWGPPDSPVHLSLPAALESFETSLGPAVESIGCDRAPLDVADPEDRLWLRSCIWGDQVDRLAILEAALTVAAEHPPAVETSDAAAWLDRQLSRPRSGRVTVVVQSIVQQYLSPAQRTALSQVFRHAGHLATPAAPLAWLRVEPPLPEHRPPQGMVGLAEVRVQLWPGDTDHLLAHTGYHGQPVHLARNGRVCD